jgi:hypothetical protein
MRVDYAWEWNDCDIAGWWNSWAGKDWESGVQYSAVDTHEVLFDLAT